MIHLFKLVAVLVTAATESQKAIAAVVAANRETIIDATLKLREEAVKAYTYSGLALAVVQHERAQKMNGEVYEALARDLAHAWKTPPAAPPAPVVN